MPDEFRERMRKAKGRLPTISFKPEEFVTGVFQGIRKVQVQGKERELVIILDDADLELKGIWSTVVLMNMLKEKEIRKGERIGIKYFGKEKNYHNWGVEADRPEQPSD